MCSYASSVQENRIASFIIFGWDSRNNYHNYVIEQTEIRKQEKGEKEGERGKWNKIDWL